MTSFRDHYGNQSFQEEKNYSNLGLNDSRYYGNLERIVVALLLIVQEEIMAWAELRPSTLHGS